MSDLHNITKAILEDTYDEKAEDQWLNKIIYQHLPVHQKLIFRSKFLKDVPQEELGIKPKRKLRKTRLPDQSTVNAQDAKYASACLLDQN